MYSRKLDGKVLEFGHEGVLYRNSFVMYDRSSHSLWIHTTGGCVKGKLKGAYLDFIPSSVTTWANWRASHPDSLVLEGEGRGGFMGTYTLKKTDADDFGLSVGQGEAVKLYPISELLKRPVVEDTFAGQKIVIFFDKDAMHGTAWLKGDDSFKQTEAGIVDQKGRVWNTLLGRPVGDQANEEKMKPLPATIWLKKRWHGFYPKSKTWQLRDESRSI